MTRIRTALMLPANDDLAIDRAFPIDDSARLQKAVGGSIAVVRLNAAQLDRAQRLCGETLGQLGDVFLVVNEHGKRTPPLPLNMPATMIYGMPNDVVVGNALIVEMPPAKKDGEEGEAAPS